MPATFPFSDPKFFAQIGGSRSTFSHRLHHLIIIVISNFVNHRFVAYAIEWVANSDPRKRQPEDSRLAVIENSINRLRVHQQRVSVYSLQNIVHTSALYRCAQQKEQNDTQQET